MAATRATVTGKAYTCKISHVLWLYASSCGDPADAKEDLLFEISYTNRGATVSRNQRGAIEEAQIKLENLGPDALDFGLLKGAWRLVYTTAADVAGVIEAGRLGPLQVGEAGGPKCS